MGAIFFVIAIIISFITQIPFLIENGIANTLKLVWLLPLGYYLISSFGIMINSSLIYFYRFVITFFSYCFVLQCLSEVQYLGPDMYNIAISLMVTIVSFCFWMKYGNVKMLRLLSITCLLSCIFLASFVYVGFLVNVSLTTIYYAFGAKNSMAPLLLNGLIFASACFTPKGKIQKIFILLCQLWIVTVIFLLKSRATILGVVFVILYLCFKSENKIIKKIIIFSSITTIIILFLSSDIYDIIINQIMFNNMADAGLEKISSGRGSLITEQMQKIPDHLLFGSGVYYMDCFPLMMLVQYGIIGFAIIFHFLYKTAHLINKKFSPRKNIYLASYLIFWTGMLNSLFEAQPPFGPGIKMFLLWMCFGFSLAHYYKTSHTEKGVNVVYKINQFRFRNNNQEQIANYYNKFS